MLRRLHAPGCLLAVLSLVAPRVANAEPAADAAATQPQDDVPPAAAAPDVPASAESTAEPEPSEPEPSEALPESEPLPNEDDDIDIDDDIDDDDIDDDGIDDTAPRSQLPDRLPRLQRIGWYHVLGAFTLGTTAGLLAGLAERQEDKATRIASGYDPETAGAQLYADRQEAYETSLDRGQAYETSAIVTGALAGATAIAAITLFAVDAKRRGPSATARRTRIGPGSLEVSF